MSIRSKTNEELAYIIKDAGEAALAMRDHNPAAEAKYLDQMAEAETELVRRAQAPRRRIRSTASY